MVDEVPPLPAPDLDSDQEGDNRLDQEDDYSTQAEARGRMFYISLGFMKYGTRDQIQGASFFLAFILILIIAILAFINPSLSIRTFLKSLMRWIVRSCWQ